jgi:hypothetical protein
MNEVYLYDEALEKMGQWCHEPIKVKGTRKMAWIKRGADKMVVAVASDLLVDGSWITHDQLEKAFFIGIREARKLGLVEVISDRKK